MSRGRGEGVQTDCHRRGESPEEGADCFLAAVADGIGAGLARSTDECVHCCAADWPTLRGETAGTLAWGVQEMTVMMLNVPFASGVPLQ